MFGTFSRNFSLGAMWLLLPKNPPSQHAGRALTVTFWPLARGVKGRCNLRG
jgi:hypothetical protein